jgi:hypothetical protein
MQLATLGQVINILAGAAKNASGLSGGNYTVFHKVRKIRCG